MAFRQRGFGTAASINSNFNYNPIPGTGPYVVTDVAPNEYVEFSQNPNYWGRSLNSSEIASNPYLDPGHVNNVIVYYKTDDVSRYTDLATNAAQIATIQSTDWPLVQTNPNKYAYFTMPAQNMLFVGVSLNTERYPTNITAVRQAIVHAINYTDINQEVFFGALSPMLGQEYPVWKQFYDLGNLTPYTYNMTLATQDLSAANINVSSLPTLQFNVISGCISCISTAQIIQADLSQIGINVNIQVLTSASWSAPLVAGSSTYSGALQIAQQVSQLTWFGPATFAPDAPTPADAWLLFVNNESTASDYAIYANPNVQPCVDAWTNGSSISTITSLCTLAQSQIYSDAPYIWLGSLTTVFGGGSKVWNKNIIQGFLLDPVYSGQSTTAIFNTVTFTDGQ